jgi:hypothetical protein
MGKQLFASSSNNLLANYWQKRKGRQWRPYKRLKISSPKYRIIEPIFKRFKANLQAGSGFEGHSLYIK